MVYGSAANSGDGGQIASRALANLLEEARKMGATRVGQERF